MELFKYVISNRIDILEKRLIRFTQPSLFNDPWEALPRFDALIQPEGIDKLTKEVFLECHTGKYQELLDDSIAEVESKLGVPINHEVKSQLKQKFYQEGILEIEQKARRVANHALGLRYPRQRQEFIDSTFKKLDEVIGILCLSENNNNLLMWSHYAAAHTGFVIGFDSSHIFFDQRISEDDIIRKIKPVSYSKKRPSFLGFTGKPKVSEIFNFASVAFFTKSDVWSYEQEWRMVHTQNSATEKVGEPALEIFFFDLPSKCISSVILGCRTNQHTETKIRNILKKQNLSHVCLKRALQDPTDYKINIVDD
jgi:hypothetical protein